MDFFEGFHVADSRCLGEGPVTFVEVSHYIRLVAGVQFGGKEMAPRPPNEAGFWPCKAMMWLCFLASKQRFIVCNNNPSLHIPKS